MTTKTQTNQFPFFFKQQYPIKGIIDFEFLYSGNYIEYPNWLIEGFDSYQKAKLYVLISKNSKYLFYQYNGILRQNNFEVKKFKHTFVTDDYVAIKEIQSQNWQYFVESVLDARRANNVSEKINIKEAQLLINSAENITICKETYQTLYNQVAQNLSFTINNLPADEMMEINKELQRENYWANIETVDFLDCWSDFFFAQGRFLGSQELKMVPQTEIPKFFRTQTALPPIDLYQRFKAADAKALVSVQPLAALNIHLGGRNRIVSKICID